MKQKRSSLEKTIRWRLTIAALLAPAVIATHAATTPSPISSGSYSLYPYQYTGLITVTTSSTATTINSQTGSGAVVRNPRVVFSCAHVVYKEENVDPWLSKVKWHRAWSSGQFPASTTGQTLRSYYYFVGYSSAVKNYGTTSSTAFANDFVVHYAYEDTGSGGYAGWWTDGTSQLKSGVRQKLITGYPSGLYGSSHSWKYLMHETGPFYDAFSTVMDTYLRTTGVSTAQGNSGGPVWVWDSTNGQYYYAGVLISGLTRSLGESDDVVGVYGVDDTSKTLIEAAIAEVTDLMPVITQQPSSRRVTEGSDATFSVKATGGKLSYLWYMDGPFGPQMLLAETKATLTLKSVKASDAGTYYVVVTGADGTKVTSKKATLTVDPPNTAPVVSKIKNYTIDEDTPLTIKFTIRDTETSASKLKVTRSSGDTKLFPLANLKLGGSGTNRTLKLTPAKNLSGKAKIKVKASDGSLSHTRSFTVTVQAVNDPPTLGALEDITIKEDTSKTITLKIGDAETSASKLKVSVATSNTTLTPKKALVLGGSGSKRTLKITPAKNRYGSANITVTVSDGKVTKKRTFKLTVKSVNDAPTLSKIAAQTVKRNKSTPKIPFTIGDAETAAGKLILMRSSSDTKLLPLSGLKLGGSGANRTIVVKPAKNKTGQATVMIAVSDGKKTTTRSFSVTVSK